MQRVSIHDLHREIILKSNSPGFDAPPPKVLHRDLIPEGPHTAMLPAWTAGTFQPRPLHVVRLFDVYLTGEGLLFDRDKNVISESVTQYEPAAIADAERRVLEAVEPRTEWGSCVLLRKRGDSNYGHWMIELLPKLWVAEDRCNIDDCVIPKRSGAMEAVMKTALRLSSSGSHGLIEHSDDEVIFFKQLIFVEGLTAHGVYMSPLVFSKTDKLVTGEVECRRIFVSRRGAARDLANEDEVIASLKGVGFEVIHPGGMSLEEQARAFAGASHVVGVMGAGLTNIMFCAPGAKVINLAPATFPDTFFYLIAQNRKLDYTEIRGANLSEGPGWDQPFLISPQDIVECL
jgi:hypothetical protein